MKIELLSLGVCAALCASAPVNAQVTPSVTWSAPSAPIQTTLAGGPWLLPQGGPYQETLVGTPPVLTTTTGGPFDGPIPYCSAGTPIVNPSSTVNTMQPFYFPFVTGRGLNLQGYFDYRPRDISEAVVAANSTDGGQTWHFQQQVESLNTVCPQSDANGANGNENGEGHPNIVSFGGGNILFLLDRRNGHADFDGLLVHDLTPKAGAPLYGLSALTELGPPTVTANSTTAGIITQWNMASAGGTNTHPTPNTGSGTANPLGMKNSYSLNCGSGCSFTGSVNSEDLTATPGGTNQSYSAKAWRIRGTGNNNGGTSGNGWSTQAPQYTQGAQFLVNTTGYHNIAFEYDWYVTAQGARNLQAQYTTDGTTWTNVGPLYVGPAGGDAYYPQIEINFAALGIHTVDNNPNFGVQLVSAYDPTFVGPGTPCTIPTVNPAPCTYTAAKLSSAGAPVQLNNTSGNWRFDEINVLGTPTTTNTLTFPTKTIGLTNPDGILASVPGYPFKILYVSKTLNGDYALPTTQQCGSTPSGKAANHDLVQIRIATSTDGIHWTDQGVVTGLNDPTTISYSGVRYAAPNGTLLKLSTGNWGLFFGGGNCLDGDSDSFHAILYAESSNLTSWTMINGINNPIASISSVTATDPVTQQVVTIPGNTPVVGATQPWFSGRVYGPQAAWASPTTVNLIFAGYNATYSADLSDYRTIGQVGLTASGATLP
jgi:hypothetical protein